MEPRGTRLEVRVTPGARRTAVSGRYGDAWKISVAAPPERGRANGALTAFLAAELGVPSGSVRVLRGQAARTKLIEIDGLDAQDVERLLTTVEQEVRR